jgi:glutamate-ammonia-ligase adenylyltransferase
LADDMSVMRNKIAENFSPNDIWNIKYAYGGLFEIEFIFQYLILTEAANFPDLAEASLKNLNIAETLKAKAILSSKAANELGEAYKTLRDVQSAIRLTSTDEFNEEKATENHKKILLNSLGETKFDVLKNKLIETQKIVHTYYKQTFQQ